MTWRNACRHAGTQEPPVNGSPMRLTASTCCCQKPTHTCIYTYIRPYVLYESLYSHFMRPLAGGAVGYLQVATMAAICAHSNKQRAAGKRQNKCTHIHKFVCMSVPMSVCKYVHMYKYMRVCACRRWLRRNLLTHQQLRGFHSHFFCIFPHFLLWKIIRMQRIELTKSYVYVCAALHEIASRLQRIPSPLAALANYLLMNCFFFFLERVIFFFL